ncbi:MAG TPA: TRAP transporter TatT component family protein, partial [Vicinamibacterales bacterium]
MPVRVPALNHIRSVAPLAAILAVIVVVPACSVKTMAVKTVANTLSDTGDVFTRDDDPELIRDATPFALKLYESLLESVPTHVPLLVSTCGGFTQYGYAFLEAEADGLDASRRAEATALRDRALKHYLRARGYCLRGIDARFGKGSSQALLQDPAAAVKK